MALGTTAALLMAGGAFTAATQIGAGQAQSKGIQRQAEYNAQVYEQQAEMIKEKKKIQDYQYNREAARMRGTLISRTAGKGLLMGGSPLAILIDNETNMQFDKAIADYNLDIERNYAMSGATYQRQTGVAQSRLARTQGYTNAFSTMLNTGLTLGMMNLGNPLASAKPGGTRMSPSQWWGGRA